MHLDVAMAFLRLRYNCYFSDGGKQDSSDTIHTIDSGWTNLFYPHSSPECLAFSLQEGNVMVSVGSQVCEVCGPSSSSHVSGGLSFILARWIRQSISCILLAKGVVNSSMRSCVRQYFPDGFATDWVCEFPRLKTLYKKYAGSLIPVVEKELSGYVRKICLGKIY